MSSPKVCNLLFKKNLKTFYFHRVSPDFNYTRDIEIFKADLGNNFIKKEETKLNNEELYPWRATMSNSGLNLNLRSNNESLHWW